MTKAEIVKQALEADIYINLNTCAFVVTPELEQEHSTESWVFSDGSTLHLTWWPGGQLEYSTGDAGSDGVTEYQLLCEYHGVPSPSSFL